jgi:hypothetical protein
MKVEKTNLGGGLYRLDLVRTACWENLDVVPQHVKDSIMKDVITREKNGCVKTQSSNWNRCCADVRPCGWNRPTVDKFEPKKRSYAELDALRRHGEPDGIDIHVDRPLRENFGSLDSWARAMAKYRTLEDVAKDCDWECREPMKGTDFYQSPFAKPSRVEESWVDDVCWFDDDEDDDFEEWSCLFGRY